MESVIAPEAGGLAVAPILLTLNVKRKALSKILVLGC
jgi:hypothetical protein